MQNNLGTVPRYFNALPIGGQTTGDSPPVLHRITNLGDCPQLHYEVSLYQHVEFCYDRFREQTPIYN